jgi:hypothetical protein
MLPLVRQLPRVRDIVVALTRKPLDLRQRARRRPLKEAEQSVTRAPASAPRVADLPMVSAIRNPRPEMTWILPGCTIELRGGVLYAMSTERGATYVRPNRTVPPRQSR